MILILILTSFLCFYMAYRNEKEKQCKRIQRKKERAEKLTAIPWNAAEEINCILQKDLSKNKEYKLAVLVVEDEFGNKRIEDIDLRGETAELIQLSSFAINKNKDKADKFLFDYSIINSISNKVNCCVDGYIERYYAFQLTLENLISGRHGKIKTKVKDSFVMFMDLSEKELKSIANLTIA